MVEFGIQKTHVVKMGRVTSILNLTVSLDSGRIHITMNKTNNETDANNKKKNTGMFSGL